MADAALEGIADTLIEAGYPVEWNEEGAGPDGSYLAVSLPPDNKGRVMGVIVKVDDDIITMPLEEGREHTESAVQMLVYLPFTLAEEALWETLRMINFFNSALPTPGFMIDEGSGKVFFRYTFLKPGESFNSESLLALLGMVMLWLDTASEALEEVAQGKPMLDVVKENIEALKLA